MSINGFACIFHLILANILTQLVPSSFRTTPRQEEVFRRRLTALGGTIMSKAQLRRQRKDQKKAEKRAKNPLPNFMITYDRN